MKPSFSNLEVLKFAISLEVGGIEFYEEYAAKASGDVKALFLKLADDERQHAAYFQKLYDESSKKESNFEYMFDETVTSFFESYAKNEGFGRGHIKISTIKEAIEEAMTTEILTIAFYEDLMEHAKEATSETLKKLIVEEEIHRDLLKDMLAAQA